MATFSITRLEEARLNPSGFVQSLRGKHASTEYRYSKFMAWQNAVIWYHKLNSKDLANRTLVNSLSRFSSIQNNKKDLQYYIAKLELYIRNHNRYGYHFVESRKRIKIPINSAITITGQIPIVNLTPNLGYGIIFFAKKSFQWEYELRFPLVQSHFAEAVYGCNLSEIEVGIYCFETSSFHLRSFSKSEITLVLDEIADIGDKMSRA